MDVDVPTIVLRSRAAMEDALLTDDSRGKIQESVAASRSSSGRTVKHSDDMRSVVPKDQTTESMPGKGEEMGGEIAKRPAAPYHAFNLYSKPDSTSGKPKPIVTGALTADTRIVDPDRRLSL